MITLRDFLKLDKSGVMFTLIDANIPGAYSNSPAIICRGFNKNAIRMHKEEYLDYKVSGFIPVTSKHINLYIKKGE